MSTELFVVAEVMTGKLNDLVKSIMRQTGTNDPNEAIRLVESGDWIVSKLTAIYLSVKSDGTTGPDWEKWFDKNNYDLSLNERFILNSSDFKPTKKGTIHNIAVLKGMFFEEGGRITKNIRAAAYAGTYAGTFIQNQKLFDPNAEVACLIREKLSDEEIKAKGLSRIVVMHEPIKNSVGFPWLLCADCGNGGCSLNAWSGRPDFMWHRGDGFAFAVSQRFS